MLVAFPSKGNDRNIVAIRICQEILCFTIRFRNNQSLETTSDRRRNCVARVVEFKDGAIKLVAMLPHTATGRQHMIKFKTYLGLPEPQHWLETVCKDANVKAVFSEPRGKVLI